MEKLTPFQNRPLKKKVVVLDSAGLYHIVGSFDPSVHTLRPVLELADAVHGRVEASLHRVLPRLVIYRQNMPVPTTGRLGEFHPEQR